MNILEKDIDKFKLENQQLTTILTYNVKNMDGVCFINVLKLWKKLIGCNESN